MQIWVTKKYYKKIFTYSPRFSTLWLTSLLSIQPLRLPEKLIRWVLQFWHLFILNREIRLKSVLPSFEEEERKSVPPWTHTSFYIPGICQHISINCTKTDTSGPEEYSKVMGELSIRNSAKFFRKFARRKSERKHRIGKGNCLLKTQL